MKSSSDRANESIAAAMIPGTISGSVTLKNVLTGLAPKSSEASSRVQSKPRMRARTVIAMKLISNATWAIRTVTYPVAQPMLRNRVSNDAPITTSGEVSGRIMKVSTAVRPRNRCRTRAMATNVPNTSAIAVDTAATFRLSLSALLSAGYLNGCAQFSSVKPCQV